MVQKVDFSKLPTVGRRINDRLVQSGYERFIDLVENSVDEISNDSGVAYGNAILMKTSAVEEIYAQCPNCLQENCFIYPRAVIGESICTDKDIYCKVCGWSGYLKDINKLDTCEI